MVSRMSSLVYAVRCVNGYWIRDVLEGILGDPARGSDGVMYCNVDKTIICASCGLGPQLTFKSQWIHANNVWKVIQMLECSQSHESSLLSSIITPTSSPSLFWNLGERISARTASPGTSALRAEALGTKAHRGAPPSPTPT